MNITHKQRNEGFTIIEVVLVLAIAALIFLMVFIALPALQRSQRDTQRKDDLARAQTAIQNFQSNNQNALPFAADPTGQNFIKSYLKVGGSSFQDPDGTQYTFKAVTNAGSTPAWNNGDGVIYYLTGAICGPNGSFTTNQGPTKVALDLPLEGGGVACVNN